MASRFGDNVSDTTFRNVTFPRSTFRRRLRERGKGAGEGTEPEWKREGKNEGKRVGGKGPEITLENL